VSSKTESEAPEVTRSALGSIVKVWMNCVNFQTADV